jgi:hypothetical protein
MKRQIRNNNQSQIVSHIYKNDRIIAGITTCCWAALLAKRAGIIFSA